MENFVRRRKLTLLRRSLKLTPFSNKNKNLHIIENVTAKQVFVCQNFIVMALLKSAQRFLFCENS